MSEDQERVQQTSANDSFSSRLLALINGKALGMFGILIVLLLFYKTEINLIYKGIVLSLAATVVLAFFLEATAVIQDPKLKAGGAAVVFFGLAFLLTSIFNLLNTTNKIEILESEKKELGMKASTLERQVKALDDEVKEHKTNIMLLHAQSEIKGVQVIVTPTLPKETKIQAVGKCSYKTREGYNHEIICTLASENTILMHLPPMVKDTVVTKVLVSATMKSDQGPPKEEEWIVSKEFTPVQHKFLGQDIESTHAR